MQEEEVKKRQRRKEKVEKEYQAKKEKVESEYERRRRELELEFERKRQRLEDKRKEEDWKSVFENQFIMQKVGLLLFISSVPKHPVPPSSSYIHQYSIGERDVHGSRRWW